MNLSLINQRKFNAMTEQELVLQETENILNTCPNYSSEAYWDRRYEEDTFEFDFYVAYNELKPFISEYIKENDTILNVGCGNSPFCSDVLELGVKMVNNIDFSGVVIAQMKRKYESEGRLTFEKVDATSITYSTDSFNVIFDKGTLDSFISTTKSVKDVMFKYLFEIHRVLKPGGYFIEVSYGVPSSREHFFDRSEFNWKQIDVKKISKSTDQERYYYMYVYQKGQKHA